MMTSVGLCLRQQNGEFCNWATMQSEAIVEFPRHHLRVKYFTQGQW